MEIIMACRLRDFPVMALAVKKFEELWPQVSVIVACPAAEAATIRWGLPERTRVVPERELTPAMDVSAFRRSRIAGFPGAFGWYYQQILKMNYARITSSPEYLVWDADTIPLHKIDFRDPEGRIFLTVANEYHKPYFETFRRLLGADPPSAKSFISQHMLVDSAIMRELLESIESKGGCGDWTLCLERVLLDHSARDNLFSEYETYGNFLMLSHPMKCATRTLRWAREENRRCWARPKTIVEQRTSQGHAFLALESKDTKLARAFLKGLERCPSSVVQKLALAMVRQ